MEHLIKSASDFSNNYSFQYQKPTTCPHCGYGTDATFSYKTIYNFNGHILLVGVCRCTACQKQFLFVCEYIKESPAENVCVYPSISFKPYENKLLASFSEHFIDMYNQALASEFSGNIELAAIGYRSALEILIKDYAINELHEDAQKVSSKKLFDAVKDYLKQDELINTADVVRILGNDYTHYTRKYPQHDFDILKTYMEILIKQVEVLYMIKHPPVSRTP